jgi:hypothetical protein
VTHVWNDTNLRNIEEQREHYEHKECQYHGSIEDDEKSSVAVSLCDGMVSKMICLIYNEFTTKPARRKYFQPNKIPRLRHVDIGRIVYDLDIKYKQHLFFLFDLRY